MSNRKLRNPSGHPSVYTNVIGVGYRSVRIFFRGLLIPFCIVFYDIQSTEAQEILSFPFRQSDLQKDEYWTVVEFSEGRNILDMNVLRANPNSWSSCTGDCKDNADQRDWGIKIHAPADGEVVSCWNTFPDDENLVDDPNIYIGGNHITIRTGRDNFIALAHMQQGSIPPDVCPDKPSGAFRPGSSTHPRTPRSGKEGKWHRDAYIATGNRPTVREGVLVGRVGTTGSSGGPHLHIQMNPLQGSGNDDGFGRERLGNSQPLRFKQIWGQGHNTSAPPNAENWFRFRGTAATSDQGKLTFLSSPFLRRGDEVISGSIKEIDITSISNNRMITATIRSDNRLRLQSYDLVGIKNLEPKHSLVEGVVKDVKIIKVNSSHVLIAIIGQNNELKLIAYHVDITGRFHRVAERTADQSISDIALARTTGLGPKTVTAIRDRDGNLKLTVWKVNFGLNTTSINKLSETSAGQISAVSMSAAAPFSGVFVAVRDSVQKLRIIPWLISQDGSSIERGETAILNQEISTSFNVTSLKSGMAAAVRQSDGRLRVITWEVSSSGEIIREAGNHLTGPVSEIALLRTPLGGSNTAIVIRDGDGLLRILGMASRDNGRVLRRLHSSVAGEVREISAVSFFKSFPGKDPRDFIITAVSDSNSKERLVIWDTNLVDP